MAGFLIAATTCMVPLTLGFFRLGRPPFVMLVGGVLALGWVISMLAAQPIDASERLPLWFGAGLALLLYAIWCGGLWLGLRFRRIRRPTPG